MKNNIKSYKEMQNMAIQQTYFTNLIIKRYKSHKEEHNSLFKVKTTKKTLFMPTVNSKVFLRIVSGCHKYCYCKTILS